MRAEHCIANLKNMVGRILEFVPVELPLLLVTLGHAIKSSGTKKKRTGSTMPSVYLLHDPTHLLRADTVLHYLFAFYATDSFCEGRFAGSKTLFTNSYSGAVIASVLQR